MSLTLAAVGAVVAALIELTVLPYLRVGGAHLHLVLVLAIVWTLVVGIDGGLVWAFLGGLMIDFLAPRPIGSTAFVLLVAVGAASLGGRLLGRVRYVSPILVVFALSLGYSLLLVVVLAALRGSTALPTSAVDPLETLLPGALFDAVLAAIVGPLAISARVRAEDADRVGW